MKTLIENRQRLVKLDLRRIRRTVREAAKHLGCPEREVSLLFVDNEAISEINRQYLNRPGPTNVISFSQTEGDFGHINPLLLGDIVISAQRAVSDAQAGNLDVNDEIDFLVIHGLLHLLGYNHEGSDEREAVQMREMENEIFQKLRGFGVEST
ncbi:MAG: Endoribonuclease YbeY [Syntrophaceae bacterium PtaB.Bin095]|jgi:probable rRNA maturation factor|nr:MAG: Endoribonuclease YbeY [Syntrophaceae bacterium PtaB.Bin095]